MKTKICEGDLIITEDTTIDYEIVTGSVYVSENAKLSAPQLTTIGGYVYVRENAKLSAPQLTTIGGSVYVYENAKLSAKIYEQNRKKSQEICSKIKRNGFETPDGKYIIADGILSEIVSHKANVWKVKYIAKNEIEFLIMDGNGNYAHGTTLQEAKDDLVYKVTDRRKEDYENHTLASVLTHEEAIKCYRTITGACSAGTRAFVESVLNENRKEKYTIKEMCELTIGQYGNETFTNFFKK